MMSEVEDQSEKRHGVILSPLQCGTAGVGAEFGFAQNWTARIEYLYVDLSNSRFAITGMPNGTRFGLVRLGVNYRF